VANNASADLSRRAAATQKEFAAQTKLKQTSGYEL